jgi:SPP1 family predicted phage head-tail adaptor
MSVTFAGARRRTITVQEHDGTLLNGQPTYNVAADWDTLSDLATVPAAYTGVSGGEVIRGLQIEANATGLFKILSTTRTRTIKPIMRIQMDGRNMNILSITDMDGDQRELWIQVKEQADA